MQARYSDTGVFIALEGGEGAGKSTQAKLLERWLTGAGHDVVLTREPGGTAVGAALRAILLDHDTGTLSPRAEALVYAADRAEHVDALIRPALAAGSVVITDRYVDSTLAYQGAGRSLDTTDLEQLAQIATGGLRPHLTVVLDIDPVDGLARAGDHDRIEAEPLDFHQRVREQFLALAAADPDRYVVVSATEPPDAVHATIRAAVEPLLPVGRSMSVWDELVGQGPVVESLQGVVTNPSAMTHAWLFTGPPGSGRSNAAKAFAAALQCPNGGCGSCESCTMVVGGTHPDVSLVRTDGLSIGVDTAREYVRRAALAPALGRWQILIVEDADRLTDQAANALLKSIEEPARKSLWFLCATAVDDVMVTVRSRCRPVLMRTPSGRRDRRPAGQPRRHRPGRRARRGRGIPRPHRSGQAARHGREGA